MPAPRPENPPPQPRWKHWVSRLRLSLRRQTRKLYRSIRHPRQRAKGRLREWLGSRIHNRDLWHLRRHPVANGLAGGMFISMLPIPLQSLAAAAVGIARGWNLPAAVAATWVSNPLTYVPIFLAAKQSVLVLYHLFGVEPAIRNLKPSAVKDLDFEGVISLASHAGPELLLGYIIVGILSALAAYIIVHSFWWLIARFEPPPGKRRSQRRAGPHPANP